MAAGKHLKSEDILVRIPAHKTILLKQKIRFFYGIEALWIPCSFFGLQFASTSLVKQCAIACGNYIGTYHLMEILFWKNIKNIVNVSACLRARERIWQNTLYSRDISASTTWNWLL